jgi:hypothetical protein
MCNPAALIGMQVAGSVMQYQGQKSQATAVQQANEQNYATQMEAVPEQYRQNDAQAANDMAERARQALIERGRLSVLGGESGLSGVSTQRLLHESAFTEGTDISTIDQNRVNTNNQIYAEAKGARATTQSRIASINRPSLIGTGLQIAGDFAKQSAKNTGRVTDATK